MQDLKCPDCSGDGHKFMMDKQWWFECFTCGLQLRMKFYRERFENNKK